MHLIFSEKEEERDQSINKFDSILCPMQKLSKSTFLEKWKALSSEVKFKIGKVYSNKEASIIRRLQAHNFVGCAMRSNPSEKTLNIYMCCTNKNNILILFEMVLYKLNHIYAEIKYKSESNMREVDFEKYMTIILSEEEVEVEEDIACR